MGIDEIKRWQWVVIGLLVGLGLGWAWSSMEPGGDGPLVNQIDFERELTMKHQKTGEAVIKDVVLQPITKDYRDHDVQPVSFMWLREGGKSHATIYAPAKYIAQLPYKPVFNAPRPMKADLMLSEYLTGVAKTHPGVSFQYGWYSERPAALAIWTVGAVVIIGGIWPTLLNMLTGARPDTADKKKKKQKKEDYFDRFSHAPAAPVGSGPKAGITDADRAKLDHMTDSLERELVADAPDSTTIVIPEDQKAKAEVRKLDSGPLEKFAVPQSTGEEDEVEIKGEYYPVLIHHKKQHEEEEPAANQPTANQASVREPEKKP